MENRTERYNELRRRYPVFEYAGYEWREEPEGLRLEFDFRMGDVQFRPMAIVERRTFLDYGVAPEVISRLVFDIGMVELVSYWKSACPPTVRIGCGALDSSQVAFWKKLYWNGLGEFYYTNGISESPDNFMQLEGGEWKVEDTLPTRHTPHATHYLVPVGGGKDSVVTLELLRRAGKVIRPLVMNPRGATEECCRVAGFPLDEVLVVRRTIDPTLLRLNAEGYLNGHTPFSAMLAFYTRLASVLSGIPNVALSNESSANEATVPGSTVNHQYSKSLEFEDDFREYCLNESLCDCLSAGAPNTQAIAHSHIQSFNYFSFLRPLSELQIAMIFSRLTAYHDVFRSCNVGSKQDIWCGHCAKCLFAYIILAPFIEPARLNAIFGKAMLDDLTLEHEFLQLVGKADTKPFECVGTVGEVRQALSMAVGRWYTDRLPRLIESMGSLDNTFVPERLDLMAQGNLSQEERNIIEQCIANTN